MSSLNEPNVNNFQILPYRNAQIQPYDLDVILTRLVYDWISCAKEM